MKSGIMKFALSVATVVVGIWAYNKIQEKKNVAQ